jgi:sugar O-acyltransferase (sialic acid O-acetyltransferase NeuD family)
MKTILYLCGAGNAEGVRLALRINEKQKNWKNIFILDDDPDKSGSKILGIEILGPFDILKDADSKNTEVVNLVARTTSKRKSAYERISEFGIPFVSLIDPSVDTWGVEYKGDVIIYPNVTFAAGAVLDHGSVAFTGAVIGHGCTVGKFCIIAPGAVLNARIIVEDGVYIGTNSSILPDLKIGAWATIGLNSGVIQNVPAGATAMGVPAELIIVPKIESQTNDDIGIITDNEELKKNYNESHEDLENNILKIWKEMLQIETIKLDDNFFDLGGHSLLAVQLYEKLKNMLNTKITLIDIFHYPTIQSFIEFLENKNSSVSKISLSAESKRVSLFRQRFAKSSSENRNTLNDSNTKEIDQE